MRAAVVHDFGNLKIENVSDPVCDEDSIIVKTPRAAICNATDVEIFEGTYPLYDYMDLKLPYILGHERCGEIVEVGRKVTGYEVGERIGWWYTLTGAFAEFSKIKPSEVAIAKLSDNISDDEGALMELVGATMCGIYSAPLLPGDKVAILGQGPVGLLFTQEVLALGAYKVVTFDFLDFRLRKSEEFGADLVINLSGRNFKDVVKEVKSKVGEIDLVIDAMGTDISSDKSGPNLGINLLKKQGRYLMFGQSIEDHRISGALISANDIRIGGMSLYSPREKKAQDLIEVGERLVAGGKVNLKPLITHHVPLENVEKGLELCKKHKDEVLKVIIDIL